MVILKEIKKAVDKLRNNSEKIKYLNELLDEIKDKELKEQVKEMIEDIKELEAVTQIETRKKVDWSLQEEEEPMEERRLERQLDFIHLSEEEKKEEIKIDYGLQSNVELYQGRRMEDSGIGYKQINRRIDANEGKSFIERGDIIERRASEQFTGKGLREPDDNLLEEFDRYHSSQQDSRGYASLSEEIHEKEKKRLRH
jgi:hypothetical protein